MGFFSQLRDSNLASLSRPCLLFELLSDSCLLTVDWSHSRFPQHREYFTHVGDKLNRAIFATMYRLICSNKGYVDLFSID